ncbi:MAG: hypothetical protein U0893_15785 [Chloroflexota bacterium]
MALPNRRTHQRDDRPRSGTAATEPDWRTLYEIENPADVDAYVADHPSVTAILTEAPNEIHAVFGNEAPPRLRLEWDPEDGDGWLFVGIPSEDLGPSVLPLIDALEERWWLDRMRSTDATVVFDVATP